MKTVLASENIDKGKSILGASPKLNKKDNKNPRAKKDNTQKSKQKKQHLYHHCGATRHTRPNCYKWLVIQQSNSMISSGNQNQFPSSLAPLEDLLKPLCSFRTWTVSIPPPPHRQINGLLNGKVLPRCGRKKARSDFVTFLSLPLLFACITCVFCFLDLSQSSFMLCFI